jgi:motility quorum-sensing regulator/GCU-specific mRNA interferase toxin
MEKLTPHCSLTQVKAMIEAGKVGSTITALAGAAALGVDFGGMLAVVVALKPKDFYKSYDDPCGPSHLAGRVPANDSLW